MTRQELAKEYFLKGYNCAQAVALAFIDDMGLTEKQVAMMSSAFGGGMGKMGEVCGAVSGMFIVLGVLEGTTDPSDAQAKATLYKKVRALADKFKEKNESIICREILSEHKNEPTVSGHNAHCITMVMEASGILDEYLRKNHNE